MNENNELNDIILNKSGSANSNKKIILAVATLGVILIIVVMLMNTLSSSGTDNLPQAVLPPQPQEISDDATQEPLFEEIEVAEEADESDSNLEKIAQKLKEESTAQEEVKEETVVAPVVQKVQEPTKVSPPKVVSKPTPLVKSVSGSSYYIQVGSFSKYEPNKRFLSSITSLGFKYTYHEVNRLNKVLVGPFKTENEAKDARRVLRAKVEPGAFLIKL